VCNICDKAFISRTILNRHALIHSAKKPHVCGVCLKGFTRRYHLERHKKTHDAHELQLHNLMNVSLSTTMN
jgi:uncharacterized Zn-finger protein